MKKRQNIRFPPPGDPIVRLASIEVEEESLNAVGLLKDESYHGCSAVFREPFPFKVGQTVRIDLEKIKNLEGEIKWIDQLDEDLLKVGIYFS